jgi:hypothetical protein
MFLRSARGDTLSMRYKIFHVYWVCSKIFSTCTECAVKKCTLLRSFKHVIKTQKIKNFQKIHLRHTYGSKNKHHQHLILVYLKFFSFLPHTECAAKKQKTFEIRGQLIKTSIFVPVPKSHTQMGSLSVKKASEKFSRLGTYKVIYCNSSFLLSS